MHSKYPTTFNSALKQTDSELFEFNRQLTAAQKAKKAPISSHDSKNHLLNYIFETYLLFKKESILASDSDQKLLLAEKIDALEIILIDFINTENILNYSLGETTYFFINFIAEIGCAALFSLAWNANKSKMTEAQMIDVYKSIEKGYRESVFSERIYLSSTFYGRGSPIYKTMSETVLISLLKKNALSSYLNKCFGLNSMEEHLVDIKRRAAYQQREINCTRESYIQTFNCGDNIDLMCFYGDQYSNFIEDHQGQDLLLSALIPFVCAETVLAKLLEIGLDSEKDLDAQKSSALKYLSETSLSPKEAFLVKTALIARTQMKIEGSELNYLKAKTKYLAKISDSQHYGDTATFKAIMDNLNHKMDIGFFTDLVLRTASFFDVVPILGILPLVGWIYLIARACNSGERITNQKYSLFGSKNKPYSEYKLDFNGPEMKQYSIVPQF